MTRNTEQGARAPAYRIVRHYSDKRGAGRTIMRGLSLTEAQAHCRNPESSSATCTHALGLARKRKHGAWFDAYEDDRGNA